MTRQEEHGAVPIIISTIKVENTGGNKISLHCNLQVHERFIVKLDACVVR